VVLQVPAPFGYERASSVQHALALLEELGPEARLLAGGHSLLPMMKLRLAAPDHVIDIDPLADELGYIVQDDGEVRIGAMTRHRALLESEVLDDRLAIFKDAERVIADPVVRNRGTIGGALCQADPSEDLSAVCAAVNARMVIRSTAGERIVTMDEFHRGPYETAVGPAEMLVEILVPAPPRSGSAYEKVDRRVGDWAVVAAGAALALDEDGAIAHAGVALAAAGGDITSAKAEQALHGERPAPRLFAQAGKLAAAACDPVTDQRGTADYKRHVAGVLVERALKRAAARAQQQEEE
jgi:aerobic carbon-monoxide dehydrogenase medium subunit